jgi:hypothetical protein
MCVLFDLKLDNQQKRRILYQFLNNIDLNQRMIA